MFACFGTSGRTFHLAPDRSGDEASLRLGPWRRCRSFVRDWGIRHQGVFGRHEVRRAWVCHCCIVRWGMIRSKEDLRYYLKADAIALGYRHRVPPRYSRNPIWKFQRTMRYFEYYGNRTRVSFIGCLYRIALRWRYDRLSAQLGFTIPPNVFGPGLSISHRGTIVVNGNARIGANCRIHVCVNIGVEAGGPPGHVPVIGDNVYIGPGAKIFGDIQIADGIAIGANAVVNKSFREPNITIGGVPARKISNKGSTRLLVRATEVLATTQENSEPRRTRRWGRARQIMPSPE